MMIIICYYILYSKVVSTHLWNTPLNLYSGDSFHNWLGGLPGVCALGVCCNFLGFTVDLQLVFECCWGDHDFVSYTVSQQNSLIIEFKKSVCSNNLFPVAPSPPTAVH